MLAAMSEGTLTELDPIDALGWIDMDDGSRVRVGGTALSALRPLPEVGTRLRVLETQAGFRGVLKATRVEWAEPQPPSAAPAMAPEPPRVTWEKLVARHPRWSDLDAVSVPAALDVPPHYPVDIAQFRRIVDELDAGGARDADLRRQSWVDKDQQRRAAASSAAPF